MQCDSKSDCQDQSDEANCPAIPQMCNTRTEFDCDGAASQCINNEQVCDKQLDCLGGEDEAAELCQTETSPCEINNGGCSDTCVETYRGHHICECESGYVLDKDNRTCVDRDECAVPGSYCSQLCKNFIGGYKCDCVKGYAMEPNNPGYCRAVGEARILFANRHDLRDFHPSTNDYRQLVSRTDSAIAMDFDYENRYIFWSDVAREKIYMMNMTNAPIRADAADVLVNQTSTPDGVAFDWVHRNLYWTDTGKNTIEVISLETRHRKIVVQLELDEPRALVVDPRLQHGKMYWTDWGESPRIEVAGLDGSHRNTIVHSEIQWPNGLTIDYVMDRLYWVDAKRNQIGSCNLLGNQRHNVLQSPSHLKHPFAISLFEDYVYWTDWETESVYRANKFKDSTKTPEVVIDELYSPMDIHIFHRVRQPEDTNFCATNNGGCSHLCLRAPYFTAASALWSCHCPDGMNLLDDGKTCEGTPLYPVLPVGRVDTTEKPWEHGENETPAQPVMHTRNGPEQNVGKLAGIIVAVLIALVLIGAVVGYFVYRSYIRRNVKTMNFDNPVYRKTTEEQFSLEKNQYQPARNLPPTLEPLNAPTTELV